MTFDSFKNIVAAYVNRSNSSLLKSTDDILLLAINNAKKWAQREHDFVRCEDTITGTLTAGTGTDYTTFLNLDGASITVNRLLRTSWFDTSSGLYYNVPILSPGDAQRKGNSQATFYVYQKNTKIYIGGTAPTDSTSTITARFDVVKWLPDYTDGGASDFFIDFCSDWLLFSSVFELNFFLKEDQRIPMNASVLQAKWESVKKWDNAQRSSDDGGVTLD